MEYAPLVSIVRKVAPLLATVLTETNPIAELVLNIICSRFNVYPSDVNNVVNAIKKDSEADNKICEIEADHHAILMLHNYEDVNNARNREEKIIELTGKRDWILDFLSILVVISFFTLIITNYFFKIKDDQIVTFLIGQISSGFTLCLSYYFGSSNAK